MKLPVLASILTLCGSALIAGEAPSPSDGASQTPATPAPQKGNNNEPTLVPAGKKASPDGQVGPISSHESAHGTPTPATGSGKPRPPDHP